MDNVSCDIVPNEKVKEESPTCFKDTKGKEGNGIEYHFLLVRISLVFPKKNYGYSSNCVHHINE